MDYGGCQQETKPLNPSVRWRARWHRAVAVGVASCWLGGCAVARNEFVRLNPQARAALPHSSDTPVLLMVGEPERPYEELGMIFVSGVARTNHESLNEELRKQARLAGADAVIYVRYGTDYVLSLIPFFASIPYEVSSAQGLAVRFTERR